MVRKKQSDLQQNDILRASEIGQYMYCSIAWYLQRCGYKPDSQFLEIGKKTHSNLGYALDNIQNEMKRSRRFAIFGLLLFIIAIFGILYEVIL